MKKIIVLIIDSDAEPIYAIGREIWRQNAKLNNLEIFFLRATKDIKDDSIYIEDDVIYSKWIDDFSDRLIDKTLKGFIYSLKNLDFKFILRTNLSSFFNIPLFKDYINSLSESSIYAGPKEMIGLTLPNGISGNLFFCSGSGYLISKDLVNLIVEREPHCPHNLLDDVWIGMVLIDIQRQSWMRCDLIDIKEITPETNTKIEEIIRISTNEKIFHYRINNKSPFTSRQELDVACWKPIKRRFLNASA